MSGIDLAAIGTRIPEEDQRFQRECVSDLLQRSNLGFPGAQPVSFARKHLLELQQHDYFLCEKTDGIRCLLFLSQFTSDGGIEAQFLVDRKNDYYYIQRDALHIPRAGEDVSTYHTGTLLDGELVLQKTGRGNETRLAYLIFDILALDGENIMSMNFSRRYGRAKDMVYGPHNAFSRKYPTDAAAQPFALKIKNMELPYSAQYMFQEVIPKLPHGNDGLIYTCVSTPYTPGTDEHILKWKPPQENTIDFLLQLGAFPVIIDDDGDSYEDFDALPEINLLVKHGNNDHRHYAQLLLTSSEWEATKKLNRMLDGTIMECYKDSSSSSWRPKIEHDTGAPRFRDDKTDANHISTVVSVMESIEDAVSEEDLVASAGKVKATYKERAARAAEEKKRADEAARQKAKALQHQQQQQQQQQQKQQRVKPEASAKHEDVDDGPRYAEDD